MADRRWAEVDAYIGQALLAPDSVLEAALRSSDEAGLPPINVAPNQGKLLMLLAQIRGARRILEVGTLGGYSTIWLARSLPADGRLLSLEIDPHHAEVARANVAAAGLADRVEIILGPAVETLARLGEEGTEPFDFVFIDADKQSNADYFRAAVRMSRPGTVIVVDNVVRNGAVADAASSDPSVQGVRRLNEVMAAETRVSVTAVQTVGVKGYDGFALALVES
ncbi:MAG: O-methyltransferase [Acidimicrobiales bacterium]